MSKMTANVPLGAHITSNGVSFCVWAPKASKMHVCLFSGDEENENIPMDRDSKGYWHVEIEGLSEGARYGFRADGAYDPDRGLWFDPSKLLLDPYATKIDRAYLYDDDLTASREANIDTAKLVPKAVVCGELPKAKKSVDKFPVGGLIYELQVKSFTKQHPDIPEDIKGTIAALGHPIVIEHLKRIGVNAVEMMPITAWIDERHLIPLGLNNSWGYNPVSYFALDPKIAPGGIVELRKAIEALHEAGISVFQDVVFNHNGESDKHGPTLSFRGLDAQSCFRNFENEPGHLINDTGCGNSIDCSHPIVRRLILDSMRYFVEYAGIDGFRFDLGPALGREDENNGKFNPQAELLQEILADDVLKDCVLIAEPWDIGPGGYQLGNFPSRFYEWNDAYRDDVRRFWRNEDNMVGKFATRLCGSADIFQTSDLSSENKTRSINFVAAHDGFSLLDLVSYEEKHNFENGESNRDGHNENISWNNGVEGDTDDIAVITKRRVDLKAILSSLFLSRGPIMLTAGDEFGRSQKGNNNAYAQDNETTWLNWEERDTQIERHVSSLAEIRKTIGLLDNIEFVDEGDVVWRRFDGDPMTVSDWETPDLGAFAMEIPAKNVLILFNRTDRHQTLIRDGNTQTIRPRTVNVLFTGNRNN